MKQTGYLERFFQVYASTEVNANLLCMADVEDLYAMTYVPQEYVMVHLPGPEIHFKRQGKWYVASWEEPAAVYTIDSQNEVVYTRDEF